jgi:hypothetical protein
MPQDISPQDAHYRRICNAEQRLAVLRDLTELGMALTRHLVRCTLDDSPAPAAEAAPAPAPRRDPADAFARLSRAIRLTLALEAKAEGQLAVLRTLAKAPAGAESPFPGNHTCPRRNRVRNAVFDTVDREITGREMSDYDLAKDILETTHESLAEGEAFEALVDLPLKEAVEKVFRYFKMQPDLSHWTEHGPPPSTRAPAEIWRRFWAPPAWPRLQ